MNDHFKGTFIILTVIFGFCLAITIIVINFANKNSKSANPTVVPKTDDPVEETTTVAVEEVTNISSNLKSIIDNNMLLEGQFNINLKYNGVNFSIICNSYDFESNKCIDYSGTMIADSVSYNLFKYTGEGFDYINHLDSYYIYLNENNVLLSYSDKEKSIGSLNIYDRKGNKIKTIANIIHSYYLEDVFVDGETPYIEDNNIYYFMCSNNKPTIYGYSLENGNISKLEIIKEANCYK